MGCISGQKSLAVSGGDRDQLIWATGHVNVDAGDGDDWIAAFDIGQVKGGAGDDKIVSWWGDYVFAGEYMDPQKREQAKQNAQLPEEQRIPIEGRIADRDYYLTLDKQWATITADCVRWHWHGDRRGHRPRLGL